MGQIQKAIEALKPQRVHLYTQPWWGDKRHIDIGYRSDDASIIARQISCCKAVCGSAKIAMVPDIYGPSDAMGERHCELLAAESEHQGTEFSLMIDKGAVHDAQTFEVVIAHIRNKFFPSHAYSRSGGKYLVWAFGITPSAATVKRNPDVLFITENTGSASFAWPNGFKPGTPQAYLSNYLAQKSSFMVPCLWPGFDDHKKSNHSESVWGGPARFMDYGPGYYGLFNSLVSVIAASGRKFAELGITFNDFEERTQTEVQFMTEAAELMAMQAVALRVAN